MSHHSVTRHWERKPKWMAVQVWQARQTTATTTVEGQIRRHRSRFRFVVRKESYIRWNDNVSKERRVFCFVGFCFFLGGGRWSSKAYCTPVGWRVHIVKHLSPDPAVFPWCNAAMGRANKIAKHVACHVNKHSPDSRKENMLSPLTGLGMGYCCILLPQVRPEGQVLRLKLRFAHTRQGLKMCRWPISPIRNLFS